MKGLKYRMNLWCYNAGMTVISLLEYLTLNIRLSSSISDFPGNRGFLVRSSAKIQPTDHMSTAVLYSCKHTQTLIYGNTLHNSFILEVTVYWVSFMILHGHVLTVPVSSTSKFLS